MEWYTAIISLGVLFGGLTHVHADLGNGILYGKPATANVWLENSVAKYFYNFLIVSNHQK